MSIRVLVVDDQAVVRVGFRTILRTEPDMQVVGEASDGLSAIEAAWRLEPDVVLMDVRMPGLDGLEATRRLVDSDLPTAPRVLILTTYDLDEYLFGALRAGACGFLLKNVTPDELVQAVRIVATGDSLLTPALTRRLIEEFTRLRPPARRRVDELGALTGRETEVLTLVARGLSNAEIAAELVVAESTVKTHVNHLLTKLHLRDRVHAVIRAYEVGLVHPGG